MEKVPKLLLHANTTLSTAFDKLDKDHKGYLNEDEKEQLKQFLIERLDSEHVNQVFSKLPPKVTLEVIETWLDLTQAKERSRSAAPSGTRTHRGLDAIGLSTAEQMIPAARIICVLQLIRRRCDLDAYLSKEINWCIEQINTGNIYDPVSLNPSASPLSAASSQKAQALPWLAQFSTPQLDMDEIQSLLHKSSAATSPTPDQAKNKEKERVKRRSVVARDIADHVNRVDSFLSTVNFPSFDIVRAEQVLGREKVLPLVAFKVFQEHQIFSKTAIDENAFVAFVSEIRKGYVNNPYHNDVHAADVLQMCHYMLTKGRVQEIAKLSTLDVAALLLSAIIHDYKHPGVTNGFLINSNNELALAYNDKSVLESYHVSEAFKLMDRNKECAVFKNLTTNERILMRKRMISCVLATDMAIHNAMMQRLKNLMILHRITKGKNNSKIINAKEEFESKQFILDLCLHFADCGNPCREFEVYKGLVVRLMEEFGRQGDVEKSLRLPVSFLCDRTTLNLPASQIGFIAGVIKPMVKMFVEVFPELEPFMTNLLKNEAEWKKVPAK